MKRPSPFGLFLLCILVAALFISSAFAAHLQSFAQAPNAVGIVSAGDNSGRLFVIQQTGQIRILRGQTLLPRAFLNIKGLTECCSQSLEQGLLGLAFHPNYKTNGYFFIYYSNLDGNIVLERYHVSRNPDVAEPKSGLIILTIPHRALNEHYAGQLQFGPDGFLYIGVGDGGGEGDPANNAQNLGKLLGKILRIDVNGAGHYAIPPGNPFLNKPGAKQEIWNWGLRNPWRFSFDRLTGDLFIGDVALDSWEEVDYQAASSHGGINYGWHKMEGRSCFNPTTNCNDGTLRLPIIQYSHGEDESNCAIIGGYVYRGKTIPSLNGAYLYGDYCSGRIWSARRHANGGWSSSLILEAGHKITSWGQDENGELYLAGSNHIDKLIN